ncbi:hypothetical protein [Pedobacter foliorum]|uniref:hypothetical protein n=1 Tax=Pedobacter foliorum TaxID=2739058 RepID=UPI0015647AED|nr:hypothetical protein [Pedobacter foliorum]NRF39200.1 hypothetical protein [Pedobacter foliorum]
MKKSIFIILMFIGISPKFVFALRDSVFTKMSFPNPKVNGTYATSNDDSDEMQTLIDKGGIVNFPVGRVINILKPLVVKSNGIVIKGNMCTINYAGTGAAIDFSNVNNKNYPVRVSISDLSIVILKEGATGIRWKSSYSSLKNCSITLTANNQTGVELSGDVNGTGSYYNLFENCFIQGANQNGKINNFGWKFTYSQSMPSRCPNANTWIGGRVGQCDIGMYINGNGNVINHMAAEGSGVAFYFDNKDSKVGCVQNKVVMPYVEVCKVAFKYGQNSLGCLVTDPYMTGAKVVIEDVGAKNVLKLTN